ncbi:UNVERIFIED_CONTAM: hypothetical protein FKN15_023845 [Acipenser sinensis]
MAACSRIGGGGHSMDKSITLPPDEIFRNLENAKRFAIDIGGSLTKLAYYSTVQHKVAKVRSFDHTGKASEFCMNIKPYRFYIVSKTRATRNASEMNSMAKWFFQETEDEPLYEISVQEEITARLHFIKFENAYIETCLDFVKDHLVNTETKVIKATGGGAHKFKDLLEKKLKLKVDKEDEMSCLIKGCNFVLKNIPHEAFVYVKHAEPEFRFQTTHPDIFPYLLINIGSGVSIVKVESEDKFERIGGSSIGGGTFWGLGALLTKTKRFDELLQLASRGQHTSVDMLVKDIYGGAYGSLGLTGDLIASSFGKSATADKEFSKEDMAKSLLHMISNDIGQLACLYAKLHNLSRVYFGGFFIRGHPVTMHTITYSINFFTKGEVQALFLRHEGYLGAIGAFLKGAEEDNPNQYSWGENYAGSSGLMSVSPDMFPMQRTRSGTNIPHEAFVYVKHAEPEFRFQTTHPDIFPYLLINIGSGVSIVKVESEDKFERIGGSSIGGGTFWGLGALLTKTKRFDELLQLASRGQHTSVDMLVKDIYGGAYGSLGLTGDLIASSFGKSATADKEFSKEDMAKSLLHMISNDIGQLACLYAKLHNLSRVYFGGFFIRGHPVTMHTITYSINFFTKGEVQALFLRHEGYLGAIGAFLKGAEEDNPNQYSWGENYAGSSGLMSVSPDMFPMQRTRSGTVVKRAVASQPDLQDARERAEKFRLKYRHKLQTLRHQPCAYGSLTIKQRENDLALRYFQKVVRSVEMLNWEERQFALVKGLLAGNMFDWGAKAVSDVLETDPAFGFDEAKRQLQERPWLVDSYSKWIERLKGPPHKCALFFVDNSGIDIILGVFPLVRELLCRGTEIIQGVSFSRSRLDKGLATLVRERHTDLVVIEGMGRAIHTNYYAVLRCESLKLAVIKNSWLAERLGGKIYSVVFKYEQPSK